MSRVLYGIGVGPGDPELITVKGLRLLQQARVVFFPATRPGQSYARQIVDAYLDAQRQQLVELVCPAYRDRAAILRRWDELAELVAQALHDGAHGAFVSEGDPSLYSTFQYLASALRRLHSTIEIGTIPGITSVSAAAALAGMPLALWDERLAIVPAIHDSQALFELLQQGHNTALLKVSGALGLALEAVERLGPDVEVALVRRAGRPDEAVISDPNLMLELEPDYFTTLLVRRKSE